MTRLSSPIENMRARYDAIVIGSGYGGGIAASRLARAGLRVCLLERGREIRPGDYPDTPVEATEEIQFHKPNGHVGSDTGMFDFHVQEEISVLVGCGLGGTSLINANVALEGVNGVFTDERWPVELRDNGNEVLAPYYDRARSMLGSNPYPDDFPALPKIEAHEKSAKKMGLPWYKPPINVTFEDKVNHAGVAQKTCINCGDCVTGCNHMAKNTTLMNYLPDAWNHGTEFFTECSVNYIERADDGWVVRFEVVGHGRSKFDDPNLSVTAGIVVVSAGTLGSSQIMLQSKEQGLPLSDRVGKHFSGNGDILGFSYNNDLEVNGIGFGTHDDVSPVGPTIASIIDNRGTDDWRDGWVMEEGAIPGALGPFLPEMFSLFAGLIGKDTDSGAWDWIKEKTRAATSWIRGPYHGAVHNTETYLGMCHDGSDGEIGLTEDGIHISWPGVGEEPIFEVVNDQMEAATAALGGTYIKDPIWTEPLGDTLISVHPLGGCVMADDASKGVTNHKGQVFSGTEGTDVHDGLYVTDGSIVPLSIGVNPLLTISALSERVMEIMAEERGWALDTTTPSSPDQRPADAGQGDNSRDQPSTDQQKHVGVEFTESMKGYVTTNITGAAAGDDLKSYEVAEAQGKDADSPMEFNLTIQVTNLDEFLSSPEHRCGMFGTVSAGAISSDALTVHNGQFQLFVDDPDNVETKNMIYRAELSAVDGSTYYFHGYKVIHPAMITQAWHQNTTLYTRVYRGKDESGELLAKGILHIKPSDFVRQLSTMKATNASSELEKLKALARFGEFFAGTLYHTYGGILAGEHYFNPDATPRKKRPLRVGTPEYHPVTTEDGVDLLLTRYRGGGKGPVMLVHGMGVSSRIFSTDLVDTNLLEYLYAHGYDVWLFDFRISIALPTSEKQSNGDEIAQYDHPAAVAYIREHTGADSIQAVAHCYGGTTFAMAQLAGMTGIRSVVYSQVACNLLTPTSTKIKAGLHLAGLLDHLGIKSLTAYVDSHADWKSKLWDELLRLDPVGEDNHSPVSHRISFMYGNLYQLDQLDQRTFDNLHELFGVGNIKSFEHLSEMVRKTHSVKADGEEVYMPHLDRMNMPIAFIHGAENHCYLPESTQKTLDLLGAENGEDKYSRNVIPGYGHIDCIFGKNAVDDVFPHILKHLEDTLGA